MKQWQYSSPASLMAVMLALIVVLVIAPAQLNAQQDSKPAPPAAPGAPSAPQVKPEQRCADVDLCAEQIGDLARTISQEVESQLKGLKEQIQEDVEMSSPELNKLRDLSAELGDRQQELADLGARLGTQIGQRGSELAQEIQQQTQEWMSELPTVSVNVSDDGGAWLGVDIAEMTQEKARDLKLSSVRGVEVTDVQPDSPAAKAGLKEKDVITQYDGQTVEGTVQFRRLVNETPAGRTVSLSIVRDGAAQNISVELGDRSAYFEKRMKGKMRDFSDMNVPVLPNYPLPGVREGADIRTPSLGINAEDLTGQLGQYFGAPDNAGVLVREVRSGTPAEKAGLQAGDVIVKFNDQPVHSLAGLRSLLRAAADAKSANLGILRKGSAMTVTIAIEKPKPETQDVHRAQS
jgi:serine protease Do